MRSAVSYIRVSKPKQGRSGLGLEAQQASIRSFCAQHGYSIEAEYREVETGKGMPSLGSSRLPPFVDDYSPPPQLVRGSPRKTQMRSGEGFSKGEHRANGRHRAITCLLFGSPSIAASSLEGQTSQSSSYRSSPVR